MAFNPDSFVVGRTVSKPNAQEGTFLDLTAAGLLLVLRYPEISREMKRDLRNGIHQFRVGKINDIVFFLARFGMQPWRAAHFHRGKAELSELVWPSNSREYPLYVFLVDSKTGVLKEKKVFFLRRCFVQRFAAYVAEQSVDVPGNWDIMLRRAYRGRTVNQIAALFGMENDFERPKGE